MNKKKESYMLKKIMKAALAASLVFGFSSMATADVKVSGDVATYFGQYNTGVEDYTAHFDNASEGHINVTGKSGPISLFLQVESRDDGYGYDGNNLANAQLAATWTAGMASVKLGTVTSGLACEFALSSGLKTTTTLGKGAAGGCAGYFEQDGIQAQYVIPAIKGAVNLTIMPTTTQQVTAIGATGMIADMVGFRFNQSSVVSDDVADPDDDKVTDTMMHLAVKVPLGSPKFLLSLDYNTTEDKNAMDPVTQGTSELVGKRVDTAIQFTGKDLGPGTLIFTYATKKQTFDGDELVTITDMDFVYRIDLGKGVGFDIFYLSQASKYNSDYADYMTGTIFPYLVNVTGDMTAEEAAAAAASLDDPSKTTIGAGFFASF
jgi:hypothetical protein